MKIKIIADSTCDLPQQLCDKYDVEITPLYVVRGDESLRDRLDIVPSEMYEYCASGRGICTTAAVSVGDYLEVFGKYLREYDDIIHFTISRPLSACYQNAVIAAQQLDAAERIHVIDSQTVTVGISMLVIRAAELAAGGVPAADIVREMEEMKLRLDVSFMVDRLDYLRRGGRCSTLAALGANILALHPCIDLRDGIMCVGKKYRGATARCIPKYIEDRLAAGGFDRRRAFVVDSGVDDSIREAALAAVRDSGMFDEVLHALTGCTISCHSGPGALGVIMLKK